nr:hypothetical protein 12 [bacterium]BDD46709.1 hypothetical protein 20 [Paracoccaceae bacterium]
MPRKENGFGKAQSFAFKAFDRTDRGKGKGAAGYYPKDRQYGTAISRSVIEKYDLDSDWVKWRKGFEYYNKAAWYRLETYNDISQDYETSQLRSKLYQGTEYEIDVVFDGYKFATRGADSNNHYVMKRTVETDVNLGTITTVLNDPLKYPRQKANREIWARGIPGPESRLLLEMIGDRVTDGVTEATLTYALNSNKTPALYIGKSYENQTQIKTTIPLDSIYDSENLSDKYQYLVGEVVYIPEFYIEKALDLVDKAEFVDGLEYFIVNVEDYIPPTHVDVLDAKSELLPPTMYDISTLPKLLSSDEAEIEIKGSYLYKKALYQRFYGKQYLTADVVKEQVNTVNYAVMPYQILGAEVVDNKLVLTSVPYTTEFKLIATDDIETTLIFTDYSFTKTGIDEYDGVYYHEEVPGEDPWLRINTDVDPWQDEVFTSGQPLKPAVLYACSCPNFSHAILTAPQEMEEDSVRKINRQRRYPLPTFQGTADYEALGANQVAGKISSWETREHRMGFKMCKHSIASHFIEHKKIQEPNKYPSVESRAKFEEKLTKEMNEVGSNFVASYKRGGITALEVVFALAQGLNLSDVETAYVLFNNNF